MKRLPLLVTIVVLSLVTIGCGDNDEPEYKTKGQPVDLGLSVKWADMNIGAPTITALGEHFAWADPTGSKTDLTGISIRYNGDNIICQWESDFFGGMSPSADIAHSESDIATESWGTNWRMPTLKDMQELVAKCTFTPATRDGVKGVMVTGPNGNSIFMPAAGHREYSTIYDNATLGNYWTATLVTDQTKYDISSNVNCTAWALEINAQDGTAKLVPQMRCFGLSVRPVSVN